MPVANELIIGKVFNSVLKRLLDLELEFDKIFSLSFPLFHLNWLFPFKQIGPDVSISANVRIAAGVRLLSCIILDDVDIMVS